MRYSRLLWRHTSATEPTEILSEHDADGWEVRKVEYFPSGSVGYAGAGESVGGTELSLIRCPPDEEVTADPDFRILEMSKEEFERAWESARRAVSARGARKVS